jgi:RimJ/RimL family protein N-acetyltransferase
VTRHRRATKADIPFIMATERGPDYEWVVGRWDEALHRAEMAKPGTAYLIGERDGAPTGFGILQSLDDRFGNVLLRRIAVGRPGSGGGRRLLAALLDFAFAQPATHRVWLTVAPHNERARHLYRSVGFQEEGVYREAHIGPDGRRFSPVVMSLLRPEWEAHRA